MPHYENFAESMLQ